MGENKVREFLTSKLFIVFGLFMMFGIVSVFATIAPGSSIQVDHYYTASGEEGQDFNITLEDKNGEEYELIFERGLLVKTSHVDYPSFSNLEESLSLEDLSIFNVSVSNTNGTVVFNINETNYSATNIGGENYSIALNLSAGNYSYYWSSYSEEGYYSESEVRNITIAGFPSEGLIFYYKLDSTSGTTATDELGSYDGTWTSTLTWTSGLINNSALTSGTQRLNSGYNTDDTYDWSTSLWFKTSASGNNFFGTTDSSDYKGWRVAIQSGQLKLVAGNGGSWFANDAVFSTSTSLANGNWHHVVVTYNSSNDDIIGYIDGSQDITINGNIADNSNNINYAGRTGYSYSEAVYVDEIGYWTRVLNPDEVSQLYNSGTGITY